MMDTSASQAASGDWSDTIHIPPVGGPVLKGWREGTLTRAEELEALYLFWARPSGPQNNDEVLKTAICCHLEAARQAALGAPLDLPRRFQFRISRHREAADQAVPDAPRDPSRRLQFRIFRYGRYGPSFERAW